MLISYVLGQTSIILRVKIPSSIATDNSGVTGLTSTTTGLAISTIADNEAAATVYTSAASHIQTISTLGTFSAPSASNCRFGEVDSTNHKGVYELQIANARFNVSSSKSLLITIAAITASNVAQVDVLIPLTYYDPYNGMNLGLTGLPNAVASASGGLLTVGTGSGQINPTSGGVDLQTILTHAPTTTANGILDVNVKNYNNHTAVTDGNNFPSVNIVDVAGSTSAGAAGFVGIDWSAVHATTSVLDLTNTTIKNLDGNTVQTGDSYARLGAPAGASVSADIAVVEGHAATIASALPTHFSSLAIDTSGRVILEPTGLDSITAWGGVTARQAIFYASLSLVSEISGLPTSPATVLGLDGSTTAAVITFDTNNNRTGIVLTPP